MNIKSIMLLFVLGLGLANIAYAQEKKVIGTIEDVKATVTKVGTMYMLVPDDKPNQRYSGATMKDLYKVEGLKVIVSGNVLESPPNVRMASTPFVVTAIKKQGKNVKPDRPVGVDAKPNKKSLRDVKGVVTAKANTFVIAVGNTHYLPGESLPKRYRQDGMKVLFSAKMGKTPKGRPIGMPIEITKVTPDRGGKPAGTTSTKPNTPTKPNINYNKTVKDVKGKMMKKANKWVISSGNTHYLPERALAKDYQVEGVQVVFSGKVGKIPPNVRMLGTPIKISAISKAKTVKRSWWRFW